MTVYNSFYVMVNNKAILRQSNIELLRVVSMFMILVIHANYIALPHVGYDDLIENSVPSVFRLFLQNYAILGVNVFVFISGWFSVNTTKKKIYSFTYQIIWFLWGGVFLSIIFGRFNGEMLMEAMLFSEKDWFIKSYFVLMIIAPILNAYTNNTDERTQRIIMIAFLLFEGIFCWVMGGKRFFVHGYGPLHFIGLYICAQFIHKFFVKETITSGFLKCFFRMPKMADLLLSLFCVVINTIFAISCMIYFKREPPSFLFDYSNPLVIIGSLYFFLFFSKIELSYNRVINSLGASCFAVFLLHYALPTFRNGIFIPQVEFLFESYSGILCLGIIFLFLCFIFLLSVIIDHFRILTWRKIWHNIKSKS